MIQEWRRHAACLGLPQDWFFPLRGDQDAYDEARAVCASCTVRWPCLELSFLVDPGAQHGMFGGLTPNERYHLIRGRSLRDMREEATA